MFGEWPIPLWSLPDRDLDELRFYVENTARSAPHDAPAPAHDDAD